MTDKSLFPTSDRFLIAWLRYRGHKTAEAPSREGSKIVFKFPVSLDLENDVHNYQNNDTYDVSPHLFVNEITSVTDIIYQTLKKNG